MKRLLAVCAALTCVLGIISCKGKKDGLAGQEITLVMAEVNPEGTISAQMDQAFKEKVEELSGGKIKIDLKTGGILGDEESVMGLQRKPGNTIHLQRISAFNVAALGCEKSSLLVIPFTFANKDHFWKFATSEAAQSILNEPYEDGVGLKGLFYGEEGFRNFFATKKLSSPQDFNGIKLRITSDPIMKGIASGLKANAVSVGFADLYSALQTGIADAADQPLANYLANHFHNIAPYMVLDGHTLGVTEVVIASETWDKLSKEQRQILTEAGRYAGEVCRKVSQEAEDAAKAQLLAEGAVFTEVSDLTPWQTASADIIAESAKAAPELYQEILDLAK